MGTEGLAVQACQDSPHTIQGLQTFQIEPNRQIVPKQQRGPLAGPSFSAATYQQQEVSSDTNCPVCCHQSSAGLIMTWCLVCHFPWRRLVNKDRPAVGQSMAGQCIGTEAKETLLLQGAAGNPKSLWRPKNIYWIWKCQVAAVCNQNDIQVL